jgi:hypothetical protein
MNALALKVAEVLDGEDGFDAACVCVMCATWALHNGYDDPQLENHALEKVIDFMRERLKEMQSGKSL